MQGMDVKVAVFLISSVCCTLLPFARSSEDEVISSVHLEDTWRTLTEADLRTELHLPRDSKLLLCPSIPVLVYVPL